MLVGKSLLSARLLPTINSPDESLQEECALLLCHFDNGRDITVYFMLVRTKTRSLLSIRKIVHARLQTMRG